jgi:hypothetical protein
MVEQKCKNNITGRNMQGKPVLLFGRGYEFERPFPLT